MQPGVTVALATVWLAGTVGVFSATLYPSYPSLDQYSPQLPPKHHEVTQETQSHANSKLQNPENLSTPKHNQTPDVHLPIEMSNLKLPRGTFLHYGSPDRSYGIGPGEVDSNPSFKDDIEDETRSEDLTKIQKKIFNKIESARQKGMLIAQQKKTVSQKEDSDDYDSFQDQGPGSIEVYRLDLFEEGSLFDGNLAKKKEEAVKAANKFADNLLLHGDKEDRKEDKKEERKADKKDDEKEDENEQSTKKEEVEMKKDEDNKKIEESEVKKEMENRSKHIIPFLHDLTTGIKSEKEVLSPQVNFSNKLEDNSESESFGIGGVPELQVGCEGVEASFRDKRSSSGSNKDNSQDETVSLYPENVVNVRLVYESDEDEDPQGVFYEERDELIKLKKLEEELLNPPPHRGDIPVHLYEEYDKKEKLPVRGDLASAFLNGDWDEMVQKKESGEVNRGRKLLSVSQLTRRKRNVDMWGYGENEGIMPDDELRNEEKRREEERRKYERREEERQREHERRREEERKREEERRKEDERRRLEFMRSRQNVEKGSGHSHHHHHHQHRVSEENERIRDGSLPEGESERKRQEERRLRHEERRRMQEEHRRANHRRSWPVDERTQNEERRRRPSWPVDERRRVEEDERRGPQELRRPEEIRRRPDEERTREEEERRRREEQERRRRVVEEERRRSEDEERRRRTEEEERRRRPEEIRRPDEERRRQEEERRRSHDLRRPDESRRRADEERRKQDSERRPEERRRHDDERRQEDERRRQSWRRHEEERRRMEDQRRRNQNENLTPDRRKEEENEKKLRNYIQTNTPIIIMGRGEPMEKRTNTPENLTRSRHYHNNRYHGTEPDYQEQRKPIESVRPYNTTGVRTPENRRSHGPSPPNEDMGWRNRMDENRRPNVGRTEEEERRSNRERMMREEEEKRRADRRRIEQEARRLEEEDRRRKSQRYEEERLWHEKVRKQAERMRQEWMHEANRRSQADRKPVWDRPYQQPSNEKGNLHALTGTESFRPPIDLNNKGYRPPPDLNNKGFQPPPDLNNKGFVPRPDLNNKGYVPPPVGNNKGYVPPPGRNNKGYLPPPDPNNKGYQPPPDRSNKGYQPRPPPDLNNKGYVPPPPDLSNKGYVPPPIDLSNKGYTPRRENSEYERDRHRLAQERRRMEMDRQNRIREHDHRYQELKGGQDTIRDHPRGQEEEKLNSLPVSATIIIRPGGSGTNSSSPSLFSRGGFGSEIDFPGINPNHRGIQAARFPAPPTRKPPVKGPGPCIWAVIHCCPRSGREASCFESLGCPGINWDHNHCNPSIMEAARKEVAKFYSGN